MVLDDEIEKVRGLELGRTIQFPAAIGLVERAKDAAERLVALMAKELARIAFADQVCLELDDGEQGEIIVDLALLLLLRSGGG